MPDLSTITNLGGTVATVIIFIWYLVQKNGSQERAMKGVTDTLKQISDNQERHTRVLIKVADKHGLVESAEELVKA